MQSPKVTSTSTRSHQLPLAGQLMETITIQCGVIGTQVFVVALHPAMQHW